MEFLSTLVLVYLFVSFILPLFKKSKYPIILPMSVREWRALVGLMRSSDIHDVSCQGLMARINKMDERIRDKWGDA